MARQTRSRGSHRQTERFATVESPRVARSKYDRSFSHKTTIDSGFLVPVFVDEVLPGDTLALTPAFFARLATPYRPFMDGLHLDYQFFFTPLRLVWDNFIRMMGERPDPADHNDYTIPQMVSDATVGHLVGSIADYFGIPTDIASITHSALYHRNYNLCFREWYRDENLTDPPVVDMDDGPDDWNDYPIRRRLKRKDYFTGSLTFAQKGDPVTLPLGVSAPVTGVITAAGQPTFAVGGGGPDPLDRQLENGVRMLDLAGAADGELGAATWGDPALTFTSGVADLTSATSATINSIRQAIGIQHLLERDARGGTRYRETVLAHFGVVTDDIRLMRPEILATGSVEIQLQILEKTANSSASSPLGQQAANATFSQVGRGFVKSFTEHGIVMGIVSVRADLSYQQGLPRQFSRLTRYDHFWPDLAHLGEQAVLSREIYMDGTGTLPVGDGDFAVWGYQPRYEEYRHRYSMITSEFRSTFAQSLDVWHIAQDFATRPVLNNAFIEENPPVSRIVVLTEDPEFLLDCYFKVNHVRPIPMYATPGLNRF